MSTEGSSIEIHGSAAGSSDQPSRKRHHDGQGRQCRQLLATNNMELDMVETCWQKHPNDGLNHRFVIVRRSIPRPLKCLKIFYEFLWIMVHHYDSMVQTTSFLLIIIIVQGSIPSSILSSLGLLNWIPESTILSGIRTDDHIRGRLWARNWSRSILRVPRKF